MPATIEAAALCKMADRGQITGGLIDGPLAFDNAISKDAARTKGITSEVAGDPDILLAPDLEAANILAKLLTFLANSDSAGLVLGPGSPSSSRAAPTACARDRELRGRGAGRPRARPQAVAMEDYSLVLNAGSSSLKFCVYQRSGGDAWRLDSRGQVEGIGSNPQVCGEG